MIDLNSIIGRKSYRVNMPPEEMFDNIQKFLSPHLILPGCGRWSISPKKGDRYRRYVRNIEYDFILRNMKPSATIAELKKVKQEFIEDLDENVNKAILKFRGSTACELDVIISKIDDLGCVCQAICKPALYLKLSKNIISQDEITEFEIQDAYIESLNFLDQVFIGGLGAEPIRDAPPIVQKLKIIVNNTNKREITNLLDSLLDEATGEILICGWIGTHYIPKFKELKNKGINIRFITHKPQEARNLPWKSEIEEAYGALCSDIGLENIGIDPNVHGRMIIVDNKALVGSMDLNSSSLTGAHTEFAIYTENPQIVRTLRQQFNAKFKPLRSG